MSLWPARGQTFETGLPGSHKKKGQINP